MLKEKIVIRHLMDQHEVVELYIYLAYYEKKIKIRD